MKYPLHLAKGNRKLSSKILIWNLPRLVTCPGAGACKNWCYEIKIERIYPNAIRSRALNLMSSEHPNFIDMMIPTLSKKKEAIVRIHESGDFYNQEYLNKWCQIARDTNKIFYTYTKSHHLDFSNIPNNLTIFRSYGSKYDNLIDYNTMNTAIVIPKGYSGVLIPANQFHCPGKGCGDTCCYCLTAAYPKHVAFKIH